MQLERGKQRERGKQLERGMQRERGMKRERGLQQEIGMRTLTKILTVSCYHSNRLTSRGLPAFGRVN